MELLNHTYRKKLKLSLIEYALLCEIANKKSEYVKKRFNELLDIEPKYEFEIAKKLQTLGYIEISEKGYKNLVMNYDFVDSDYLEAFNKWIDYKKKRKQSYKCLQSVRAFYNQLIEYSNNNPDLANKIVEKSMANRYDGIIPLKKHEIVNSIEKNNTDDRQEFYG